MGRWDFGSETRLWEAVSVQEKGRDGVDMLDYIALTSRADDGRDPAERRSQEPLRADGGERPDDCECHKDDLGVACWPCYRDGFDFEDAAEGSA